MTSVRAVYHGHYNVRDQRGHYVKPKTARGQVCHHHCCNGTRVHPDKLPVKISRGYLRTLTEPQLERELGAYTNYSETHEQGFLQILAELDRREESVKRAAARKVNAAERRERRQSEYTDEVYRQWLTAEAATNGYMLNKAGKRANINERTLFTGPESRVRAYASRELLDFFAEHPRPTRAAWFGSAGQRRAAYAGSGYGGVSLGLPN
jgi:hypothetical protein